MGLARPGRLNPDEDQPGYRHFVIHPRPCPGLGWVKSEYASIRGRIISSWECKEDQFTLHVTVPTNTTATVYVPAKDAAAVTEDGKPLAQAEGVKLATMEGDTAVLTVESGSYAFRSALRP